MSEQKILAPPTFTAELVNVQFLTGTIALVDVNATLPGFAGPPSPFSVLSPDGAVHARARWLAERRGDEWEISRRARPAVALTVRLAARVSGR